MKQRRPAARDHVPNSTQVPDAYFDHYFPLLTDAEVRVLLYLCRRINGFGKPYDHVSLRQVCAGIVTLPGVRLDSGTGLSRPAAIAAIKALRDAGLLRIVKEADKANRVAACYALGVPTDAEHAKLTELHEERHRKRANKMTVARYAKSARAR